MSGHDPYRALPAVDAILRAPAVAALPRVVATAVVRAVLAERRAIIAGGGTGDPDAITSEVVARANRMLGGLRPVINATGVALHTNLGRAPWCAEAVSAAVAASQWCDLELDLDSGARSGRADAVIDLLRVATGAEDALVVNNGAAAVLLALTALAKGRDVVVSRGELVEIGGGFRVPDVIASGGARLVEVGTTNRTRASDFARAITPETAVLLRVHPSNFRVTGFVEEVPRAALVALAHERGLLAVEDAGSGALDGRPDEPSIRESVALGMDVVLFSGDKLLGGPQAGCAVGSRASIAKMRAHPLYRALRVDKVTLAALGATLAAHLRGVGTEVDRLWDAPIDEVRARANGIAGALGARGVACAVHDDTTYIGGGSLPGQSVSTVVIALDAPRPDALARALRRGDPAIVPRIAGGAVRLDARTIRDSEVLAVVDRVAFAIANGY